MDLGKGEGLADLLELGAEGEVGGGEVGGVHGGGGLDQWLVVIYIDHL